MTSLLTRGTCAFLALSAIYLGLQGCASDTSTTNDPREDERVGTVSSAVSVSTELRLDTVALDEKNPAIASNGTVALVAWVVAGGGANNRVVGTMVSVNASGNPELATANTFNISPLSLDTVLTSQSIAWDGTNFLIVWSSATGLLQSDVWGARVTPAGVVLDTTPIAICNANVFQADPSVTFDGTRHVVVWSDIRSTTPANVWGRQVSTAGVPLGGTDGLQLGTDVDVVVARGAAVASNGTTSLALWNATQSALVKGVLISSTLTATAFSNSGTPLTTAVNSGSPRFVWDGANYIVAWNSTALNTTNQGLVARVSAAGKLIDTSFKTLGIHDNQVHGIAPTGDGSTTLITWSVNSTPGPTSVVGQRIRSDGTLAGSTIPISALETKGATAATKVGGGKALVAYDVYESGVTRSSIRVRVVATGSITGTGCATNADCGSAACVDGFCCNTLCSGICQVCSATPGTCTSIVSADDPVLCTGANSCDASGTCKLKQGQTCVANSGCVSGNCVDSTCCDTACGGACDRCNIVAGTCTAATLSTVGAPACANSFVCDGVSNACPTACTSDAMCATGTFCNASGNCQAQIGQGQACNLPADCKVTGACRECTTGNCVDGFCCGTACDGQCDTCAATPGLCTPFGKGSPGAPSCAPYLCDGTATTCATTCASKDDCTTGSFCDSASGTCNTAVPNGDSCTKGETCKSGLCVDGVCCNSACEGQCEACDVATARGTCSPISGKPHGARTACASGEDGDVCGVRTCEGSRSTTSCVGYVGADVGCRDAACTDGVETAADTCDGTGQCGSGSPKKRACSPYACGASRCLDSCASNSDCATGATCDATTKTCIGGVTCVEGSKLKATDGTTTDCAPYKCEGVACVAACKSLVDCVNGFVCDANGKCVADSSGENSDGGGCNCSNTRQRPGTAGSALAFALLLGALRRRRAVAVS